MKNAEYRERRVNADNIVAEITKALGAKREANLRKDMDQYQDFWIGVLNALPKSNKTPDPIPYLIKMGYGEVFNRKKSKNTRQYVAYCEDCGTYQYFRHETCRNCHSNRIRYLDRHSAVNDTCDPEQIGKILTHTDADIDMLLTIEQFVDQLKGKDRYVAKRWVMDRADLMYDNYQKQLASELGCTSSAIAHRIKTIRRAFQVWYNQ